MITVMRLAYQKNIILQITIYNDRNFFHIKYQSSKYFKQKIQIIVSLAKYYNPINLKLMPFIFI
jgi:hypothetical protein